MSRRLNGEEIVLASDNPGKLQAFEALTAGAVSRIKTLKQMRLEQAEETGTTFEENATIKALAAAKATGKPALADDSGLEVTALDGQPGVYMANWTYDGKGGRDERLGNQRILDALAEKGPGTDRSARMVTVLALAWPDGQVDLVRGEVRGRIADTMRGNNGFGFDPVFQPDGHDRTFAEMTKVEKAVISARTRAFEAFTQAHMPVPGHAPAAMPTARPERRAAG